MNYRFNRSVCHLNILVNPLQWVLAVGLNMCLQQPYSIYCISCCSSENSCHIFPLKDKGDIKIHRFKLKEWFSGVIQENPPLAPHPHCWGRKACCKWKNLLLKPGTEPSTMSVGTASPKDSSYLFFFFLCLAHRRQRKDSFKTGKGGWLFKHGN